MDFDVNVHDATSVLPLCREELFSELVHRRLYGDITQVWHHPGHIFITTNDGHKLFTFDCKPVTHQHAFDSGTLDLSNIPSPIINIFMAADNIAIIVCRSSHTYLFKFENDSTWSRLVELNISSSSDPCELMSATYAPKSRSLIWCEKQQTSTSPTELSEMPSSPYTYRVCKKTFPAGFVNLNSSKGKESDIILHNCPPFDLETMTDDVVFLTTRYNKDQVTVYATFSCKHYSLTLYIGNETVDKPLSSFLGPSDFQEMAMTQLSTLIKLEPGGGDLGVQTDRSNKQAAALSSSGQLEIFTYSKVPGEPRAWKITRNVVDLSRAMEKLPVVEKRQWFLCRACLGLVCQEKLYIIPLKDQSVHCAYDGLSSPQDVITSNSPAYLAWILTSSSLVLLQSSDSKKKKETAGENLPEDNLLQTGILRLAHLHQQRLDVYDSEMTQEIHKLRETWSSGNMAQNHSQLAQTVSPLLEEYWKLEKLSQSLMDMKQPSPSSEGRNTEKFIQDLMANDGEGKTGRHAKLVWLSQVYPQGLLDYLCQGITIDKDELVESEIASWQALLGQDGGDLTNFEFVCRLLFLLHPHKLFNFVKCAESASEHSVGVSAFVRKKHSLMYYKAACDCLPETKSSCDPQAAEVARTKLILASGAENSVEQALKELMRHQLWAEAVTLLKEQSHNEDTLPTYLYITLKAMAQGQVLSDYVGDLVSIMPSWKSLVSFAAVAAQNPEVRQQQLSLSAASVFSQGSTSVPFGLVKPFLIDLIVKMDAQQ
ncbi:uncharacterized protein LOC101847957 [Aplysia californica]|uniref:Uncharacterized protein LOC101847957 n=1 Tax=Aplysia californica TaxID=6500 RepID=A0ABM0JPF1_APLCA|nr:uncharacterized protein LOC101847957 [Aplysia californica]